MADADLVVTGEGFLDAESFDGKVVGGVAEMATHLGVPVVAVVGEAFDGADALVPTVSLTTCVGRERALADTAAALAEAAGAAVDRAVR